MTVLLFRLDSAHEAEIDKWVSSVDDFEIRQLSAEHADSAVWRGMPFIVAGRKGQLDAWFGRQDEHASTMLRTCAYFWVLTDCNKYEHRHLPTDRITVLNWEVGERHIVRDALSLLSEFPKLAGLSNHMHHLREEILRIAFGPKGPSTPVLILGESGSGKEETAHSLFEKSCRAANPGLHCLGGAWLNIDPGLALSELVGIEDQIATNVRARAGLLEVYSEGALFVDDFDTAPRTVQEVLLRLMSTPKGQKGKFKRVGGDKERDTNAWIIFSTNANIEAMLEARQLRPDFLYRFEDRVLVIPPLRQRPADLPAIANVLWSSLLNEPDAQSGIQDRVLSWRTIRNIARLSLRWDGNVRELSALLRLTASMARMPRHRQHSIGTLIDEILSRGDSYKKWFIRLLDSGFFSSAPPRPASEIIEDIIKRDSEPLVNDLSYCENEVKQQLGDKWSELQHLAESKNKRDPKGLVRNFCRYLLCASRSGQLTNDEAAIISSLADTQAAKQLKWLSEESKFLSKPVTGPNNRLIYEPGEYLVEGRVVQPSLEGPTSDNVLPTQ